MINLCNRIVRGIVLAAFASLATVQVAQADSLTNSFFHKDQHRGHDGEGCNGGGNGPACGLSDTKYFYDFMDDGERDDPSSWIRLSSSDDNNNNDDNNYNKVNLSIDYKVDSGWNVDSAWLRVWLKDDARNTSDVTGDNRDGTEYAVYTKIEGQSVTMTDQEVSGADWYLSYDVTSLLNGSPFTATLKALSGDFKYLNAELKLDLSTAPCPPVATVPLPAALPLMLSGLGVLGFASRRRKETV